MALFLVGAFVPTLSYGLRRALDGRFDRPQELPTPSRVGRGEKGTEFLVLLRAELQRENRRSLARDIVLNTLFFVMGVGVTLAFHFLWG
jgi:hypothetical protein